MGRLKQKADWEGEREEIGGRGEKIEREKRKQGERECPTLVVHRGLGGMEDLGNGEAHVQRCQSQLIHKVWQL